VGHGVGAARIDTSQNVEDGPSGGTPSFQEVSGTAHQLLRRRLQARSGQEVVLEIDED
jgi:hypothetical protein